MIAIAEIELRPIGADARHRTGRRGTPLVGDPACADQEIIGWLCVSYDGQLVVAVHGHSMLIRQRHPVLGVRDRSRGAGMRHAVVAQLLRDDLAPRNKLPTR